MCSCLGAVHSILTGNSFQVIRVLNKEEEADYAHDSDDDAGDDEGHPPVRRHVVRGDQGTQDVSNRGVRVPQPHDQTSSAFAKPVPDAGHHTGPASSLYYPIGNLDDDVEFEVVDVVYVSESEQAGEKSAGQHPHTQIQTDRQTLSYNPTQIHAYGISTQERVIHRPQQLLIVSFIEWFPAAVPFNDNGRLTADVFHSIR